MSRAVRAQLRDHAVRRGHTLMGFGYKRIHPLLQPLSYQFLKLQHSKSRAYHVISGNVNRRMDFFTRTISDDLGRPLQVFLVLVTLLVIDSETNQVRTMERAFWRYGATPHAFDAHHNWVDCSSGQDEPLSRSCRRASKPQLDYTSLVLRQPRLQAATWLRCLKAWATALSR